MADAIMENTMKPLILFDMDDGDPARGDCLGVQGVAQRVARKLGAPTLITSRFELEELYPAKKEHSDRLLEYLKNKGFPRVAFHRSELLPDTKEFLQKHGAKAFISDTNEELSKKYLGHSELVPHHITPEKLQAEEIKFRQCYQDVKVPLIAVMLAEKFDIDQLAAGLAQVSSQYDQAAVFLCSSRRTPDDGYIALKKEVQNKLASRDLAGKVQLLCFNLNVERDHDQRYHVDGFNPYIGLVSKADHIIVCGTSISMVSDGLAAGKTVHIFDAPDDAFTNLRTDGLVREFYQQDKAALVTERIQPVDITDMIADGIISEYNVANDDELILVQ